MMPPDAMGEMDASHDAIVWAVWSWPGHMANGCPREAWAV